MCFTWCKNVNAYRSRNNGCIHQLVGMMKYSSGIDRDIEIERTKGGEEEGVGRCRIETMTW